MALGAGAIPEEVFGVCYRRDCAVVKKMLRRRALERLLAGGAVSANPSAFIGAAEKAIRRIGYISAEDVRGAVVEEYARVLNLGLTLSGDAAGLLSAQPGWTLEELLYKNNNSVVDALYTAMMTLYMEYVGGSDLQRLGILDFAAYAALELLRRGRINRDRAAKILNWIADQALTVTV
jgi:hypothetical protein